MKIVKSWAVSVLLLLSWPLAAQNKPTALTFAVKHNGRIVPAPDQVVLRFDGHSVQVPVQNGQFEVPPEILKTKTVAFFTVIDGYRIHIQLKGDDFVADGWTLVLEDHRFPAEFQPVPKGARPESSCQLQFEPQGGGDGTELFVPNCRSKIPKSNSK